MRPEREPARDQPRPLTDLEAEREVSLAGVGQTILRRWWLVAAAVVVGAVIGYLLSLGGGNVFQARATVYPGNQLSPAGNQTIQSPATNPATVGQLARSDEVVQEVAREVGVDPGQLRRGISTKQVGGTQTRTTTSHGAARRDRCSGALAGRECRGCQPDRRRSWSTRRPGTST